MISFDSMHVIMTVVIGYLCVLLFNKHVEFDVRAPSPKEAKGILDFLLLTRNLKTQKRTGWVNNDIPNAESISDHMHRMAVMGLIGKHVGVDTQKLTLMNLVHDIAEAVIGDITPPEFSGVDKETKSQLEEKGLHALVNHLPEHSEGKAMVLDLWMDYEHTKSPEAEVAHELDKLEMLIQAYEYEKEHIVNLEGFYLSLNINRVSPWTRSILTELLSRREALYAQWKVEGIEPRIVKRQKPVPKTE